MNGVTILFAYAVIMILATVILTKKEKNVERFCVGSRSENWLMSALSIAATWIWAPALFVSTEFQSTLPRGERQERNMCEVEYG